MPTSFAIDFGASNTKIYRNGVGIVLCEPTLIAAAKEFEDGYSVKSLGLDAKKLQGKTNDGTIVFSPIAEGVIKNKEYAIVLLKHFLAKVEGKNFFAPQLSIVLPVPCGILEEEKLVYEEVFYMAKVRKVSLVPEVICAALGSGKSLTSPNAYMVCNLGYSHSDIAVLHNNTIVKGATLSLGSRKMIEDIVSMVRSIHALSISMATAEKILIEIGSLFEGDLLNLEVTGLDQNTGFPKNVIVESEEVYGAILPHFEQICFAVENLINLSAPEISGDLLKSGVLICGGLSRISGVQEFFDKRLGTPVFCSAAGENSVILGAGKLLSEEKTLRKIMEEF